MAGDNVVKIVFEADASQATAGFAKIESELRAVQTASSAFSKGAGAAATSTVNWTQLTKDHASALEFMRGKVGKTAADFKPATAEMRAASVATRDASVATREVGEASEGAGTGVRSLASQVVTLGLAYEGARLVIHAVKERRQRKYPLEKRTAAKLPLTHFVA